MSNEARGELIVPRAGVVAESVGAEVDQQITTAKRYPRSVSDAIKETGGLASLSPQIAEECRYAIKRDGKIITGASSRFAEILAACWGNNRNGSRVVDIDRRHVTCQGFFIDLENNMATSVDVKRSILSKSGRPYSADMITVTSQAGLAIAHRNAVLKAVPKALWLPAYEAAVRTIEGDAESLDERRQKMLKALGELGVSPERIYAAVDVGGLEDINLKRLAFIRSLYQAVKDGEASVDEQFPPVARAKPASAPKASKPVLDELASKPAEEPAEEPEAAEAAAPEPEPPATADEPPTMVDEALDAIRTAETIEDVAAAVERAQRAKLPKGEYDKVCRAAAERELELGQK